MSLNNSDCFVEVNSLSKKFCRSIIRGTYYALLDIIGALIGFVPSRLNLRKGEFWAVKNINFELKQGQSLGITGGNGAGKSTILRMISGVYEPDAGNIVIKGKTVSFLGPGTGFHPHLTVNENIYINGAILGMSNDNINNSKDEILKFAELDNSINAPMGSLSPGMSMRLSLSIAFASKSDIYIIDEALSLGDIKFREKVINHLNRIAPEVIIIMVSHNPEIINRICKQKLEL